MSFLNPVFSAGNVSYRDGKRYAWFFSLAVPAVLGLAPMLYLWTGSVASMWLPVVSGIGALATRPKPQHCGASSAADRDPMSGANRPAGTAVLENDASM